MFHAVGPARAGMIRRECCGCPSAAGWPRTSGDDPTTDYKRMRLAGVGPARAGMIRGVLVLPFALVGWPRTSGDDPLMAEQRSTGEWLAPHERG